CNYSEGGKIAVESSVKLACKRIFTTIFTSEESPMILVRSKNVQEYALSGAIKKTKPHDTIVWFRLDPCPL
ncbi:MAG: hypothetical protein RR466_08985, partial [Hungatella sp.]